ncbi:MAG: MFS transporter [Candidatus Heimdallarchaeota archaeon]|nr:MAG: MFS transporter [Candidatus Heimdallarchaeota archaeon]
MKRVRKTPFFPLFFLFFLILLNGIGTTLPIPNLAQLADQYDFPLLGLVEALFVVILTCFIFFWGYLVDKFDRKHLLWAANVIWILPAIMVFFIPNSLQIYILGRLGMAVGLSAFSPLAYSILADFAKYEDRGLIASGLNIAWVGSNAAGILIGGFFSSNWNFSFGVVALFGVLVLSWQLFIQIPKRAEQEPSFSSLEEYEYRWRIDLKQIPEALKSRTIIWLLIQGIFALIPGSIYTMWLISFLSSSEGLGITTIGNASVIIVIIASGRALGYPFFGKMGDFYAKKRESSQIRAKIATIFMAGQAFFFFFAFMIVSSDSLLFLMFSILFWIGSFIGSASGPNRTSLLFDVSLPEHRGTLGALFSITDQLGIIIGIVLSTFSINLIGFRMTFSLCLGFYFIAAFVWALSISSINTEKKEIHNLLTLRAKEVSKAG